MWEHEPLYPCPVPIAEGESHDGGGALGPLYCLDTLVEVPGSTLPIFVACAACCARLGITPGEVVIWPPHEVPV